MRTAWTLIIYLYLVASACGDSKSALGVDASSGRTGSEGVTQVPAPGRPAAVVTEIHDGDSLKVTVDGATVSVRLEGIDAPELDQDGGAAARDALYQLAMGRRVWLKDAGSDRFGRRLAVVVRDDGLEINRELVRTGVAWHFKKYSSDAALADAERDARDHGRGLWARPGPTAPWDFRRNGRKNNAQSRNEALESGPAKVRGNRRSRRYHLPGCPGYDKVAVHNRIRFEEEAEAVGAGYKLAGDCHPEKVLRQ